MDRTAAFVFGLALGWATARWLRAEPPRGARPLTLKQTELVRGIAAGLTNKEIARRAGVAESTV